MLSVVQVRYRYRLYLSPGQQQALARAFGCARVVYNDCLRVRDEAYAAGETISDTEAAGRADSLNACGVGVRPRLVAAGAEAGTHRSAA
jgi:hypothetical protein